MAWPDSQVDSQLHETFSALINRRAAGEPMAYIIGEQGFWDIVLHVTSDVLIPRPETELLVELALEYCKPSYRLAELGTGSGAISCAIANSREDVSIIASDQSEAALCVAKANASRLGLSTITFAQGNWFAALPEERFDIIITNPPYIAQGDQHLQEGDLRFEPMSALASGVDGLDDIRHIIKTAPMFLTQRGLLLVEHGFDQASAIKAILREHGFRQVKVHQDLAGLDRVTMALSPLSSPGAVFG